MDLITQKNIDQLTRTMLVLPQAHCPVAHYFGPQIYIRQVIFPAGVLAIGHKQRFEQMNIFISGRIAMIERNGSLKEIRAPMTFMGPAGQKMGIIIETTTWLNVYPNPDDERDIDVLEAKWLDKSGPWTEKKESDTRQVDRDDYEKFLEEVDLTEDQVRRESEFEGDLIDLPEGYSAVLSVRNSDIEGKGVFTSWPFEENQIIAPVRIDGKRTILGRYLNHSADPNCKFVPLPCGDIILVTRRCVSGCKGGDQGEELTVDYRKSYQLRVQQCQEQLQP